MGQLWCLIIEQGRQCANAKCINYIVLVYFYQLMLQSTRDEHLLLGVAALMLIDLAILLPWQFVDPITCHISTWKKVKVFLTKNR